MRVFNLTVIAFLVSACADSPLHAATVNQTVPTAEAVDVPTTAEAQIDGLQDVVGKIRRSLSSINREMDRQEDFPVYEPPIGEPFFFDPDYDVFDGQPTGMALYETYEHGHLLPPRPQKLNPLLQNLCSAAERLQAGISAISLPPADGELRANWDVIVSLSKQIKDDIGRLQPLLQGPTYDRTAIEKQTTVLQDEAIGLEHVQRRVAKILKKTI